MALPSSGQISFDDARIEFSQSLAPKYTMSDWTAGAWASQSFAFYDTVTNIYSPVNLTPWENRFPSNSRYDPYLNNSMSFWYDYNHLSGMSDDPLVSGEYLYTHTGDNHCYPSSMIQVDVGTENRILYIGLSGSADFYSENVYVYYGKPWESNGTGSGNWQFITASGHSFSPYTGDINLEFEWNYIYTASLGQKIYFIIYGDYCASPFPPEN
jgi:hypothetical protein